VKVLKWVADADEIVRRIKGKKTERELIEEQKKREPEEKEPKDSGYHPLVHSLDEHHHSYVATGVGSGLDPTQLSLTPMLERKKR
jgi:hypothetical protein